MKEDEVDDKMKEENENYILEEPLEDTPRPVRQDFSEYISELLSHPLVMRYYRLMLFVFALILLAILWPYEYDSKIKKLAAIEKVKQDINNRILFTTSEIISLERKDEVEERIERLGLDLEEGWEPVYTIQMKK